jgi:hypothetical protein
MMSCNAFYSWKFHAQEYKKTTTSSSARREEIIHTATMACGLLALLQRVIRETGRVRARKSSTLMEMLGWKGLPKEHE